ncbi:hypothetical protein AJ79_06229 [Helicocarpus griseus UAMH5409]|uniref:Uncharacterized protein n=1 Tax=Helicocarpus griseus UAMH5409 TaxID=1447875 RepID=A0A2B7XF55_9EURO|nr:hypothetical protein AJ79_06229 [Helicocarpus griseus UAMH5409]
MSAAAFFQFWWTDLTRDAFLACVPKEDLLSLRLVCHDFAYRTAPVLFAEVDVEFRNGTFTRPARMAALERIGDCIKTFNFNMPHSHETFLPPLLDPATGEEQTFVYEPQVYPPCPAASRLSFPRYGTWEMTELLTRQYPPLFHAATNVPSFTRAFKAMTSLRHLKMSCSGQVATHRYRRSVVDYALISLRIAIEQAPLKNLDTLSLHPIHPGAVLYLRPDIGFGTSPSSRKRWAQIHTLSIEMDSFTSSTTATNHPPKDHLKLLHSYLHNFPDLSRLTFRWRSAQQGPCPLSLSTEPSLQPTSTEPAATLCPKRCAAPLQPLKFPKLEYAEIDNALMDAAQVSAFILEHRRAVREFNFENTTLRVGSWDEALAPLTRISGSERWKKGKGKEKEKDKRRERRERRGERRGEEMEMEMEMDVPIMFSPVGAGRGRVQKVLWEEERRKDRLKNFRAYGYGGGDVGIGGKGGGGSGSVAGRSGSSQIQRASSRTRELLWGRQEHVRRFFGAGVFSWR